MKEKFLESLYTRGHIGPWVDLFGKAKVLPIEAREKYALLLVKTLFRALRK